MTLYKVEHMALGLGLTNATKALILAVISAGVVLVSAFGLSLTTEQVAGVTAFANAVLALWVGLSAGDSPSLDPAKSPFTGSDK